MRVVADTNVLLSLFLTEGGTAQQFFTKAISGHALITSEHILGEAVRKLSGKLQVPEREVGAFTHYLRSRMTVVELPRDPGSIKFEDPDDIPVLQLLEVAGAHYFVTGDKALLELKKYKQTLILSLREAFELL